jgi:hypothetical protein
MPLLLFVSRVYQVDCCIRSGISFVAYPILWPCFNWETIIDLNGPSLRNMDLDPGYDVGVNHLCPCVSCFTRRRFLARCRIWIQPMRPILGCVFFYQVHGAYTQLGKDTSDEVNSIVGSATKGVFFGDPLWISVSYSFFMKQVGKPPDNAFARAIVFLSIVVIYLGVIGYPIWWFKHLQRASLDTSVTANISWYVVLILHDWPSCNIDITWP